MIDWIGRRKRLQKYWNKLPLARQFIISGGLFTLAAMLLCGILTTTFLTEIVLQRRGGVVSAIAQHVLSPYVQDLANTGNRSAYEELDALMSDPVFTAEFPLLDIWLPDGSILYSSTPGLSAQKMTAPLPVLGALRGNTTVQFTDVESADYSEHRLTADYIEVYFPLRDKRSDEIFAVAQLREITSSLEHDLRNLTFSSWVTVAVISVVVMFGLFSIVLEGSRTIDRQRTILSRRLAQSHVRAAHHRELKSVAQRASRNITEMTDKHLRTIGTDLHDGPAQSISFAVLKLDQVRRLPRAADRNSVVADVETILGGALGEIRSIAMALVLPDIEHLDLAQVVDRAIAQHLRRTGSVIAVDSRVEPVHVAPEMAICVFRFIQEGLNNAFHHGLPDGQKVSAIVQSGVLKLSITNKYVEGATAKHADHLGIGLYGLRARVQSVGGNYAFVQIDGETRLEMWLRYG